MTHSAFDASGFCSVLANFRRPLPLLIVEQTPTALLIDGHRDKFEIVPIKSLTYPHVFFDNGLPPQRPSLRRLKHDRSNIEVGERHDLYTLTFLNHL